MGKAALLPLSEVFLTDQARSFGKYEILGPLGRGGFATVYRARDATLDREVALKLLHPHHTLEPDFAQRFLQEARTVASLSHPHIITLYEVGDLDGQLFLAMELVDGGTLQGKLQGQGPLDLEACVALLGGIADALDYAHSRGLVHRDVKPANILLKTSHRGHLHPILSDFGLVKALAQSSELTRSGALVGTLEYMAPEQIDADLGAQIGPATDIYALGIVAYHMLSGQVPFSGSTANVMHGHLHKTPPALTDLRADVPPAAAAAIQRALAKAPGDRFPSATSFIQALAAAPALPKRVPPPVEPPPPTELPPTSSPPPVAAAARNKRLGILAAGLLLGALALFIGLNLLSNATEKATKAAVATANAAATATAQAIADALLTPPGFPPDPGKGGGELPPDPGQTNVGQTGVEQTPFPIITLPPELELPTLAPTATPTPSPTPDAVAAARAGLSGYLLFTRNVGGDPNTNEIMRYDLAGGGLVALTANSADDHIARWSPDGSQIAFTSNRGGGYDIWLMDANGDNARRLIGTGGWDEYAAWAPGWLAGEDGPIAFITTADNSSELHVYAGGRVFRLSNHPGRDEWPSWWAEGAVIAYGSERNGDMDIYLMPVEPAAQQLAQAYRVRSPTPFVVSDADENEPAWSPRGHELVFVQRSRGSDAYGQLILVDSAGSNSRHLSEAFAANPAWSPDGEWIVYSHGIDVNGDSRFDAKDGSDIWAVRVEDGLHIPLIEGESNDGAPHWAATIPESASQSSLRALITGIVGEDNHYAVAFETFGFTPVVPGQHLHFFWNTVTPANAGVPGLGPFQMYPIEAGGSGASPFTLFKISDRPAQATQICVLVANADHTVQANSGNCFPLP